jgi:hypothetical protein
MKVKVNEAKGQVLDFLVAQAAGMKIYRSKSGRWMTANYGEFNHRHGTPWFEPTTDWAQGGPFIERKKIELNLFGSGWMATLTNGPAVSEEVGPTPLVAAMRCYIASKLGDEVEVPEDLLTGVNQKGGLVK